MLQGFVSTAFVVGTLLTALMPAAGLARDRDDYRGRRGEGRYSGRSFVSPRSYYGRGYIAPRSYRRPVYRGRYNGGFYLGYGAPYGYAYDPGYTYDPGYAYDPGYSYDAPPPQNFYPDQQQYQQQYPEPQYQQPQYQQPQGYRR